WQVEGCLFHVPRGPFETESTVFRDMFLLPVPDIHEVEGLNDARPIHLEGTRRYDFEQLMKVLFHRTHGQSQELPGDIEQWTSVLKLSTLWDFTSPRQTAIDNLSKLPVPPVDKFVLTKVYDVGSWLLPAMNELVRRPEPINMEEADRLGFETALKLASVREQLSFRTCSELRCKCRDLYATHGVIAGPRVVPEAVDFTPIPMHHLQATET
ncbi:hypothetical protein BU15DRAFT_47003, partial [Melanogaster broomeanus]